MNINGETALLVSTQKNYEDVSDVLIQDRAEVNDKNIWGQTPLMLACQNGNLRLVKSLIRHKAQTDSVDFLTIYP